MLPRTRFAPSPSGALHLGHAWSAHYARKLADSLQGECILRIEDLDLQRCRPEYTQQIFEDLNWLNITFDGDILYQSQRFDLYTKALDHLKKQGVLYPCFCTRKEILTQLTDQDRAPHSYMHEVYPSRCLRLSADEQAERIAKGEAHSWRLNAQLVDQMLGALTWHDIHQGDQICEPRLIGDVILARKDFPASYHLAVVVDDAAQGITHVSRGMDLFPASALHRCLQALLQLPVPLWAHHPLIADEKGKRLAKRDHARSIHELRLAGYQAQDLLSQAEQNQLP